VKTVHASAQTVIVTIIIIMIIIMLTGTLIFDEIELQSLFECIFVDIILHADPGTREKEYFINWFT
jgi:hypothetical protein